MMSKILTTIEIDADIHKWLQWYSHEQDGTASTVMNELLNLARQVVEGEKPYPTLPTHLKLIIQCVTESLLILREAHLKDPEKNRLINELAKTAIRQALDTSGSEACQAS